MLATLGGEVTVEVASHYACQWGGTPHFASAASHYIGTPQLAGMMRPVGAAFELNCTRVENPI